MRVVVTGTPGTGKTSAVEALETDAEFADFDLEVVHLNDLVESEDLWTERDDERDSLVADLDADRVVVLRCHPEELERRLTERGESEAKAEENAESESLDVILSEAVNAHGVENVYEIATTDRDPEAVADEIRAVVAGEREPSAGEVSYIDYL